MRARVVAIGLVIAALLAGSFAVRAKGRITRPPASTPAQGLQTAVPVAVAMVRRADIVTQVFLDGVGGRLDEHGLVARSMSFGGRSRI